MKFLLCLFMLLSLISCGNIPQDTSPSPIDNNLYTLDITVCGSRSFGLGGCSYNKDSIDDKFLEIPLVYQGKLTIRSDNCNFTESSRYEGDGVKRYALKDLIKNKPESIKVCNFNIILVPDGFDQGLRAIASFSDFEEFGQAKVQVMNRWLDKGYGWLQVREGSNRLLGVKFDVESPGYFEFQGCDKTDSFKYKDDFVLTIDQLLKKDDVKEKNSCVYTMFFVPDNNDKVKKLKFNLQIFSDKIIQLPEPVITYKSKKLCAEGPEIIAAIGIDEEYAVGDTKVCKKVEPDHLAWVRMVTSNGRAVLLGVRNGGIEWKSLVKY